ncbi:MAG TPA: hypothetical protein ENG43_00680 [Candidatus Bathyarchaeota archaeon]|nr:hypothetical protein [Candidatus Bathyarchaeota archaeon]HEW89842.1 hypothetical protein [Candidatus Bathyarchaeota archaeon]
MISWFITLSSIIEVVEAAVALFVSFYALRFYSLAREGLFMALFISFLVLGLGLLCHGAATGLLLMLAPRLRTAVFVLGMRAFAFMLSACEVFAYGLLAYSYTRYGAPGRRKSDGAASLSFPAISLMAGNPLRQEALIGLVRFHPLLEGLVLAVLAYLAFRTVSNFLSEKEVNPFLVGFSFLFLTASRVCFVLAFSLALLYITAHVLQLLAFLSLLMVLLRVVRT